MTPQVFTLVMSLLVVSCSKPAGHPDSGVAAVVQAPAALVAAPAVAPPAAQVEPVPVPVAAPERAAPAPDAIAIPAAVAAPKKPLTRDERIEQALATCDEYIPEIRRRRAEMIRLQRTGSPNFPTVYERSTAWLEKQQSGKFGRALEELGRIMDGLTETSARARLARDTARRCQP